MILDINEKAICRKVANVFSLANKKNYHPVEFTLRWLESDTAKLLYEMNLNEIAQSPLYQINSFDMEMKNIGHEFKMKSETDYEDVMYWCGYFFTYWIFYEEITGKDLIEKYDIEKIMECYDTYHTLSCKNAIENAKEEYTR